MKKYLILFCFVTFAFSYDAAVEKILHDCSNIKNDTSRLQCFDKLSNALKPDSKDILRAQILTQECYVCHGKSWGVPTKYGSRSVRHMSFESIKYALELYKKNKNTSAVMQNVMAGKSNKDIELMSRFIVDSFQAK